MVVQDGQIVVKKEDPNVSVSNILYLLKTKFNSIEYDKEFVLGLN